MQIVPFLTVVWRHKWLVLLTMLVAAAVATFGSRMMSPTYSATATVRVAQTPSYAVSSATLSYSERIMNTYAQLLNSRAILERVAGAFEPALDADQLMGAVTVEVIPETELLEIAVEYPDPHVAMEVANQLALLMVNEGYEVYYGEGGAVSDALRAELETLEAALTEDRTTLVTLSRQAQAQSPVDPALQVAIQGLQRRIENREETYASLLAQSDELGLGQRLLATAVSVVDPAVLPLRSGQPSAPMSAVLGALLGLAGGVGLAFVSDHFDPGIRSIRQLEELTGAGVLMTVPALRLSRRERQGAARLDHANREGWEAFRTLGKMVFTDAQVRGAKSLLVAGAEAGVGRSTITLNLAISLAESGLRIIVVDGDLRGPALHRALGMPESPGLTSVVRGQCLLRDALAESSVPGLRLLASGPAVPLPDRVAGSTRLGPILRELETMADLVILDSPPVLEYADALELATVADRVLLVVAENQSGRAQVVEAARRLARTYSAIAGVVVNRARHAQPVGRENSFVEGRPAESAARVLPGSALAIRPSGSVAGERRE